ncbi:MAG: nucleotidyltransferase [Candidatus Obscuribacterales bacterium]|nr:nucleotidyltransferase [Candidatus Obscuribacterales bacterium]
MKITPKTTREELAAIVVQKLNEHQINAVLVGGSVVSIYTNNKYESSDLDFISSASQKRIKEAMHELGFESRGKDFIHADTTFTVEFPPGPIGIGDEQPVIPEGSLKVGSINIVMLSPTQSVMDRLAWFFHCNDRQCLDQAVWIAEKHPISLEKVESWAGHEGQEEKFKVFLSRLRSI